MKKRVRIISICYHDTLPRRGGCPPRPGTSACAEGTGGSRIEDIGKVSRRKDTGKLSRREKVAKLIGGGFVTIN